jgi:hypothetical protein
MDIKCDKCGRPGQFSDEHEFVILFNCGRIIEQGHEVFPCHYDLYDKSKGGPEESMTPPSQNPFRRG